ncbi:sensor histidine kinase [Thiolapillus sp.]
MTATRSQTARQLEDAFQAFNQLSMQLSSSYDGLQSKVAELTRELNKARDEKYRELKEKERLADQLEKLLQALPAGVLVLDGEGRVRDANRQAREMLGDDVIGCDWRALSSSAFINGGDELRLKDGRWITLSVNRLDRESGRIILLTDISETRRLQNLLNQHQRLMALGEMSAKLAHQIRTPLSTLLLYMSQMERHNLDADRRRELAGRMRDCLHHMEQTTINMLAYARRDDDGSTTFLLRDVIDDLLQAMENELHRRQARLRLSFHADGIRIRGNRDAFLGAMINLLCNALEACDERPELRLDAFQSDDGKTAIDLVDNGRGMSEEVMGRVFEPFYTTRSSGTGLGLAVVKAVIQGMGGSICLDSVPGQGTRASIRIPSPEVQAVLPAAMLPAEIPLLSRNGMSATGDESGRMENNI